MYSSTVSRHVARGTGHVHCTVSPSPESLPPVDTRTAGSSNFTLGDLDFPMSGVRMLGGEQEVEEEVEWSLIFHDLNPLQTAPRCSRAQWLLRSESSGMI